MPSHAYVNYTKPRCCVHLEPGCRQIQKYGKLDQRSLAFDVPTFSARVAELDALPFASVKATNDVWLRLDLGDPAFEAEVVRWLVRRLAARLRPFLRCDVDVHCQPGELKRR